MEENLVEQENFTNFFNENLNKNQIKIQQSEIIEEIKLNYQSEEKNLNMVEARFSNLLDNDYEQRRKNTLGKFNEIGNIFSAEKEITNPNFTNLENLVEINKKKEIEEE